MNKKAALIAAAAGVAGAAAVLSQRRVRGLVASWATNDDACAGDPMGMPDGECFEVTASDGATLRGWDFPPDGDADDAGTVLLVHCWTGSCGNWGPVARRLVDQGFRVLAYDQRGHGQSDRGSEPYSPETLASDLARVLETLDLHDVTLAGHSMGGLASMAFAAHHGDEAGRRLNAMVLVATLASPPLPPRVPEGRVPNLVPALPMMARSMGHADLGLVGLLQVFGRAPARSQLEAARRGFLDTDPITRGEAVKMMMGFDLRPLLGDIDVRTRIVAGARDRLTWPHTNQAIADGIPDSTIEFLPDRGHMLPWEAPEEVTAAIVDAAQGRITT